MSTWLIHFILIIYSCNTSCWMCVCVCVLEQLILSYMVLINTTVYKLYTSVLNETFTHHCWSSRMIRCFRPWYQTPRWSRLCPSILTHCAQSHQDDISAAFKDGPDLDLLAACWSPGLHSSPCWSPTFAFGTKWPDLGSSPTKYSQSILYFQDVLGHIITFFEFTKSHKSMFHFFDLALSNPPTRSSM